MKNNAIAFQTRPYLGIWATADGYIRLELFPDGRFDEARGGLKSVQQGRYEMVEGCIQSWTDLGHTVDGEFRGGVLYRAGVVLYRQ